MDKKGIEFEPEVLVFAVIMWVVCLVLFVGVLVMTKQKLYGGWLMLAAIAALSFVISYGVAYTFANK